MTVPFIKADLPSLEEVRGPLEEILGNGRITNFGKYVQEFETQTGNYLGTNTVSLSSGTMALLFALQSFGLKLGDKVIIPSFTFVATAQAVLYAGGIPIFAEIGNDLTLSSQDLESLLKKHPEAAAVVPVHMYGLPCDVNAIGQIVANASKSAGRKISLIYDAAHAFGSTIHNKKIGTFGDAEVFSLSVTKSLVSVEGGLVASKDAEFLERIKKMRNYGIESNYNAHKPGLNGKMSEFHAIIGLHNLKKLDAYLGRREKMAKYYFSKISTLTPFEIQPLKDGTTHTYKDLTILLPKEKSSQRDSVMAHLKAAGIETRAYFYPPVHQQEYFLKYADRSLPVTENLGSRVITLPFYSTITENEVDQVVATLTQAARSLL